MRIDGRPHVTQLRAPGAQLLPFVGKRLKTLDRGRPFQVESADERSINILVGSSGRTRSIPRHEFDLAREHLARRHELTRSEIQAGYSTRNSAYVAAMLAQLP